MGERERTDAQRAVLALARLNLALSTAAVRAAKDPDVAGSQPVLVLFALDMDGPMRPTGIQELTGLSSGGVTKLVERLEEKGLVARKTGAVSDDRRGVLVELTRRGRNTVRSMADSMAGALPDIRPVATDLAEALHV
ncbi:MAG: MarR family transcriptional regulator [Jiangellales bacterium]